MWLEIDIVAIRVVSDCNKHWRILVKNIGWANQNLGGGAKVAKSDKCMGVSQLLGARARAAPYVYAYGNKLISCKIVNSSIQFKANHIISVIQVKFLVFFNLLRGSDITRVGPDPGSRGAGCASLRLRIKSSRSNRLTGLLYRSQAHHAGEA